MSATVTCLFGGSPPCSWKSLLVEGLVSLKDWIPLLSHWSDHHSCNNQWVDLQSSPSCSSWDVVFLLSCCLVNLIYRFHAWKICRMVMNVTYCNLWIDNLKSFYVWMVCNVVNVVCHGEVDGCGLYSWSKIIVSCSCGGCVYPSVVIKSSLYRNCDDSICDVFKSETVIWIGFVCLYHHSGASNLIWHGGFCEVCYESLWFLKEVSCVDSP